MAPLISILIPCYNGEKYLAQAIDSCLAQTYRELEVVVVDDGSRDGSVTIAREFERRDGRVRVRVRPVNGGISRALNEGMQWARGVYFARLAQDDWFRADALAYMAATLDRFPDAGLVYCNMQIVDGAGQPIHPLIMEPPERALFPANRVGLCVMWRRMVWEMIGGFCPACDTAEDYDYWLRISRRFALRKAGDEIPFYFRHHPGQGSVVAEHRQRVATRRALLRYWLAELRDHALSYEVWLKVARAGIQFARQVIS